MKSSSSLSVAVLTWGITYRSLAFALSSLACLYFNASCIFKLIMTMTSMSHSEIALLIFCASAVLVPMMFVAIKIPVSSSLASDQCWNLSSMSRSSHVLGVLTHPSNVSTFSVISRESCICGPFIARCSPLVPFSARCSGQCWLCPHVAFEWKHICYNTLLACVVCTI